MVNNMKKNALIFAIFGCIYVTVEVFYRGHSTISMWFVGGLCGLLVGLINEYTPKMPIFLQMLLGAVIITVIEFISGYILNIKLGLNVWDYSHTPFNFMGQICLPFSICWVLLSYPAIVLDDYLRKD